MSIYVRCERCGETLKAEIHLQNDLSVTYGDRPSNDRYHLHKTITGSKMCFQRIELNLEFDTRKQLIAEEIVGGTRIDKSEFDQAIEDQTE